MDGFSRRILWLEVTRSNNDPKVVAAFYLKQVKELGGCPLLLVTDCGSENGNAASIQCMFCTNDQDELAGVKSAHHLQINELKGGGPFSGEIDQTGG